MAGAGKDVDYSYFCKGSNDEANVYSKLIRDCIFWTYLIDRNFASEGIEKLYQVLQENFPLGAIDDNSCWEQ